MRCVCPSCGGALPGRPGQYVKCMHCAETVYWAHGKPFRTQSDALAHARSCRLEQEQQAEDAKTTREREQSLAQERLRQFREKARLQAARREYWQMWLRTQARLLLKLPGLRRLQSPFFLRTIAIVAGCLCVWNLFWIAVFFSSGIVYRECCLLSGDVPSITVWTLFQPTLSVETARSLSQRKGSLDLDRLTSLLPDVADELSQHKGLLSLNGLTEL